MSLGFLRTCWTLHTYYLILESRVPSSSHSSLFLSQEHKGTHYKLIYYSASWQMPSEGLQYARLCSKP